jgi:hypothetical protein
MKETENLHVACYWHASHHEVGLAMRDLDAHALV